MHPEPGRPRHPDRRTPARAAAAPAGTFLAAVSVDCPDPPALLAFYAAVLGGGPLWAHPGSAGLRLPGGVVLVFQRVTPFVPPVWPGSAVVHLDLGAADLAAAYREALAAGARRPAQPDPRWTVLLDPAGHPFCLTPFVPPPGAADQPAL